MHDPNEKIKELQAAAEAGKKIPQFNSTPMNPEFKVGQIFTLNGRLCRIRKITKKDIILRPVIGNVGNLGVEP